MLRFIHMLHRCSKLAREENNTKVAPHTKPLSSTDLCRKGRFVFERSERTTHLAKVPWHASDRPQGGMHISDVISLFGTNYSRESPFSQGTPANDTCTARGLRCLMHRTSRTRQLGSVLHLNSIFSQPPGQS